ncbi:restriction endonuclease subunit S [Veillonella seminalis]|uniref:restriction endonuclease subunit S n=1 Tax=Veillonella seminalis TaxID=1502943 RepID=UPI0023F3A882|nr:restriction endonuclease subunit S [Veillonella seminalis]
MEKRKKPRIRFKGFSDDWEQRKLGDIVTRVIRKNENLESKLPLTISAQFGLIAQDEFFDKRIASKNISHYYLIRKGEFAYNKSTSMDAPWGAIKRLEHYDNGVLSTLYIMFRILDENKVNSDYIVSYYVTNLWHKGVREVAAEGARNHGLLNIAPVDFFETTLTIPSNENEQKNIGEYFRRLDRLITLHQRKLEKLKIIKKSMLEKCFPKKGEKVPKIRFSGFTDDWEQRKLGDIFEEYSEKGFSDLPALTIIQGEGTIKREDSDRSLKYDKASLLKYKLVKKGDFIVHLRSFEGGLEISKNIGVVSPAYHTFHGEGTDSTFYYWHFRSDDFIDIALKPHVYGIRDGRSINIEGMKTIKIPWTTLDEQSRIGNLIKCINRLITLHQSKLEKLQKIKKSMLERMFV